MNPTHARDDRVSNPSSPIGAANSNINAPSSVEFRQLTDEDLKDIERSHTITPGSSEDVSSARRSSNASSTRAPIAFDQPFDPFFLFGREEASGASGSHRQAHFQDRQSSQRLLGLSVVTIALGAVVGVALGVLLDHVLSDSSKEIVSKWLGFVSGSFMCTMNCLMVPMVFINIVLGIVNLFASGNAGRIGWRLVAYVSFCSLVASSIGIMTGFLFEPLFSVSELNAPRMAQPTTFQFKCPNGNPLVLEANGTLHCPHSMGEKPQSHSQGHSSTQGHSQLEEFHATPFELDDLSNSFAKNGHANTPCGSSNGLVDLSDHLFFVLEVLFPTSVVVCFREGNLGSLLVFAIAFGIALARTTAARNLVHQTQSKPRSTLLLLLFQAEQVLSFLLGLLMSFLPMAMVFLVSSSLVGDSYRPQLHAVHEQPSHDTNHVNRLSQKYGASWQDILAFVGALMTGLALDCLGFTALWTFAVTKANVIRFLRHLIPAQVFACACSSSIVSLPLTITGVLHTRQISFSLTHFVCCLGATVNKNGTAVFLTVATMYMAKSSNVLLASDQEPGGWLSLVFLAVLSSFFSIACAPIPHASLLFLPVIWHACFGQIPLPNCFHTIVAIDYVSNRMVTVVNITNDALVAWMISKQLH